MSSRLSRLRYRISSAAMVSSDSARSLATLNEAAAHPPERMHRPPDLSGDPLVLYIFRVPGRLDLCLSTARPGGDVVTDIDIAASIYYVRIERDGEATSMTLVRRNPASDSNKEIALVVDPPGHIDVFENDYANIERRYWQMNGQEHFSIRSNFGCHVRTSNETTSMSSPWAGICNFTSAKMGNAIKVGHPSCAHETLAERVVQGVHTLRHFEGGSSSIDMPISELRFNFMASANISKARRLAKRASVPLPRPLSHQAGSESQKAKRRSIFSKSPEIHPSLTITGEEAEILEGPDPRQPFQQTSAPATTTTTIRRKPVGSSNQVEGTDMRQRISLIHFDDFSS